MPFVWAKLVLGLIVAGISLGLLALTIGLIVLFQGIAWPIFMAGWAIATWVVNFSVMRYIGYLVRAGHVAVVSEAVTTGKIPENQVIYGKEKVKERFVATNVFFLVSRLVDGAVKQLQAAFGLAGGLLGAAPGGKLVVSFGKMLIGISLKYVDDCCLGWVFYKKGEGAFKGAMDGVVIYAQNWKPLLKTAFKTSLMVILLTLGLAILLAVIFVSAVGFIVNIIGITSGTGLIAFIGGFGLALSLAFVFKRAFIDSYMMVRMMATYMGVAPTTTITFDLYGKLSGMSRSFKQLFKKAGGEGPVPAVTPTPTVAVDSISTACSCGTEVPAGASFCGKCGTKLS